MCSVLTFDVCGSRVSGEESRRSADSNEAELTLRSSQPSPTLPIGIAMELDIKELQTNANILSPNTHKQAFSLCLFLTYKKSNLQRLTEVREQIIAFL